MKTTQLNDILEEEHWPNKYRNSIFRHRLNRMVQGFLAANTHKKLWTYRLYQETRFHSQH